MTAGETQILEYPQARLYSRETPEGWKIRVEGDAWRLLEPVLNAMIAAGSFDLSARVELPGGLAVAPLAPEAVPEDILRFWRDHYEYDATDPDDLIRFLELTGPGAAPLVLPDSVVLDALHPVAEAQRVARLRRAWQDVQARALAWVQGIAIEIDLAAAALAPAEEQRLRALEDRAAALDRHCEAQRQDTADPEGDALRAALLRDLQAAGVLSVEAGDVRCAHLQRLGLARLHAYQRAAAAVDLYLRSDERRSYLPDARVVPPLASHVALDWFRLGPWRHPKSAPLDWLGWCEKTLMDQRELPTGASWMYIHSGSFSATIAWRLELGFLPVLVRAGDPAPNAATSAKAAEGPLDPGPALEQAGCHALEDGALELAALLLALRLAAVPQAAHAWYSLGNALMLLSHHADRERRLGFALACLNRALVEQPDHEAARHLRGIAAISAESLDLPQDEVFRGDLDAWMTAAGLALSVLPLVLADTPAPLRDRALMALAHQRDPRVAPTLAAAVLADVPPFVRTYLVKRLPTHGDDPGVRLALAHLASSGLHKETGPYFAPALREIDATWAESVLQRARADVAEQPPSLKVTHAQQLLRLAALERKRPWWKFW